MSGINSTLMLSILGSCMHTRKNLQLWRRRWCMMVIEICLVTVRQCLTVRQSIKTLVIVEASVYMAALITSKIKYLCPLYMCVHFCDIYTLIYRNVFAVGNSRYSVH